MFHDVQRLTHLARPWGVSLATLINTDWDIVVAVTETKA